MANTIAYTSTNSPTGSLKSGVISINLNNQIIGQNYNWRNGIVFSNQYIIYSDTFTQGIDTEANAKPCAWACDYNDTALLNLINSLPARIGQAQYGSLADAMAWLQGENKYFIVNQNYPTIVTDGLKFNLDAGLTGSYPVVGTTVYDTAGSTNGSLTNGTSWVNSGTTSTFGFDGTDDYISYSNTGAGIGGSSEASMDLVLKIDALKPTTGAYQQVFGFRNNSTFDFFMLVFESSAGGATEFRARNSGGTFYDMNPNINAYIGKYLHINYSLKSTGAKVYFNGVEVASGSWTGSLGSSSLFSIGSNAGGAWFLDGNIKSARLYNKQLSVSEVLQNYYQGPIVTSGLVAAYDSGNVVSYPGSSTTLYDMTGTNTGTLFNGVTFNINQGGILIFDGTDDYISCGNDSSLQITGAMTLTTWFKATGEGGSNPRIITKSGGGGERAFDLFWQNDDDKFRFMIASDAGNLVELISNSTLTLGKWYCLTAVYTPGSRMEIFLNGESDNFRTTGVPASQYNANGRNVWLGAGNRSIDYMDGQIAFAAIYNIALTESQVRQNYGAYRNRFETNQAFATGGAVTSIVENGVRYRVHTFTSSGTLNVVYPGKMEVLVVAGGGGGGAYAAGAGGGAGGLIYNTDYSVTTGNKTVTVGAGGVGQDYTVANQTSGNNSVFDDLTSVGGGYGGAGWAGQAGANGGSGGGGAGFDGTQGTSTVAGGAGTPGQGTNGGLGRGISTNRGAGGGGGGAGVPGGDSTTNSGGNGGDGKQISINGTATYYAGGGGGGDYGSANGGIGGLGGGGNVSGGNSSSIPAGNGGTNTGGGGGGSRSATPDSWDGGNGGSGIVIIRYRI